MYVVYVGAVTAYFELKFSDIVDLYVPEKELCGKKNVCVCVND
jgi:hypothetical protein